LGYLAKTSHLKSLRTIIIMAGEQGHDLLAVKVTQLNGKRAIEALCLVQSVGVAYVGVAQ
jgi:hypothetical protein